MSAGDIIALIALMVGMQALLLVFYLKAIDGVLEKRKKGIKQILKNRNQLENMHEVVLGSLSELASSLRLYGALITRLYSESKSEQAGAVSSEIGIYDFLLEKSMHEVNIFSFDHTRKESSIKALSEEYGDLTTLRLMENAYKALDKDKDKDLKIGIDALRKRLQNNLNQC